MRGLLPIVDRTVIEIQQRMLQKQLAEARYDYAHYQALADNAAARVVSLQDAGVVESTTEHIKVKSIERTTKDITNINQKSDLKEQVAQGFGQGAGKEATSSAFSIIKNLFKNFGDNDVPTMP